MDRNKEPVEKKIKTIVRKKVKNCPGVVGGCGGKGVVHPNGDLCPDCIEKLRKI